jgi:3'-5' exoribonuclease
MNGTDVELTRIAAGERFAGALLVSEVEHRSYGDGKDCIVLTLANASGRIASAPFWSGKRETVAGVARGDVVEVRGEVRPYRGRRQLEVASIRVLPATEVDWRMLLPSLGDVACCWTRIDGWRAAIAGERLRRVVGLFYDDAAFRARYSECPASTIGHHAGLGGLLQHTCEVASIGLAIASARGADADLVVAGALLHDIGKLEAYRWAGPFETTEQGALLGHVALGLLMFERRIAAEPHPCSPRELMLLQHLIASHHGKLEFGATVPPMTLEAEILHSADDASARSASMALALEDGDNFTGDALLSARGVWQVDRRKVYRGTSDWGKEERPPSRG